MQQIISQLTGPSMIMVEGPAWAVGLFLAGAVILLLLIGKYAL